MSDPLGKVREALKEAHRHCVCAPCDRNWVGTWPYKETCKAGGHAAIDALVLAVAEGWHAAGCECHLASYGTRKAARQYGCEIHTHPHGDPRCLAARDEMRKVVEEKP